MSSVNSVDGPVAVTGASGYVGSHVVIALMKLGYAVHACVTDLNNPEKTEHLLASRLFRGNAQLLTKTTKPRRNNQSNLCNPWTKKRGGGWGNKSKKFQPNFLLFLLANWSLLSKRFAKQILRDKSNLEMKSAHGRMK